MVRERSLVIVTLSKPDSKASDRTSVATKETPALVQPACSCAFGCHGCILGSVVTTGPVAMLLDTRTTRIGWGS